MSKRKADCTPEEWAQHLARQKARFQEYRKTPAFMEAARARAKAWWRDPKNVAKREANKERRREAHLLQRYKITRDELDGLHAAQEGKCAGCGRGGVALHVDHCHATGAVRGLLCFNCNSAEGLLGATGVCLETWARNILRLRQVAVEALV
jgi:hypothetical protein